MSRVYVIAIRPGHDSGNKRTVFRSFKTERGALRALGNNPTCAVYLADPYVVEQGYVWSDRARHDLEFVGP